MLIVILPLAIVAIAIWLRLLRKMPPEGDERVSSSLYRTGDAVAAAGLAALFVAMIALSGGAESGELTTESVITGSVFYLTLVIAIYALIVIRGNSPAALFGLRLGGFWRQALFGAGALLAAFPIVQLANFVSRDFLFPGEGSQAVVEYLMENRSLNARLPIIVLAVVVAPFAEEFIFRGFLYGVARRYGGRLAAICATSLLFAAIHLSPVALPGLLVLAVCLALAYELSGSLWVPITMHAIFNGITVALILLFPEIQEWS